MKKRAWIIVGAGVALLLAAALLSAFQGWAGTATTALLALGGLAWTVALALSWRDLSRYLTRRSARYGVNALVLSFLVAVVLFLVGFLADRHAWRHDFTANREHSLSDKSLRVLQGIRKRVDIHVFFDRSTRDLARDLLNEYTRRNRFLRLHIDDLNKDPEQAERYGVDNFGTVIFDAEDKIERITALTEEDVTNALIKVSRPGRKKVYFLTDHGEKDIESKGIGGYTAAVEALRRENYDPVLLSLRNQSDVPADSDVLVIAGPKSRFLDSEIAAVQRYLESGRRLFLMLDPRFNCGIEPYTRSWGIQVGDDRVVDPSPTGQLLGRGAQVPLVNRYGVHAITRQFRLPTFFELARSVRPWDRYTGTAESAVLMFTGEQSWAEGDLESGQISYGDANDIAGPVPLAMAVRLDVAGKIGAYEPAVGTQKPADRGVDTASLEGAGAASRTEARMVVIGDSDFASNRNFPDMGNGNFFLNCVAWLAQDEDLIAVRPKDPDLRRVSLTKAQLTALNLVTVGIVPAICIALGIIVTLRRRARG